MRHHCLLFATFLLVSCVSTTTPATDPTSTPGWLPTQLPASGLLYLPLASNGTPEPNPVMVVEAAIMDTMTHQPLTADVYILYAEEYREPTPGELVLHSTEHFEIKLSSRLDSWFVVRVPGYQDGKLRVHYHLKTSRKLSGPIQLQPLGPPLNTRL